MIDKNKLLLSKADDLVFALKKGRPVVFTHFLSFDESYAVMSFISKRAICYRRFGGYDDAERTVIAMTESETEYIDFPIKTLCFELSRTNDIVHKDVLGALMSLGIKRELIGDIIFTSGICLFFVLESISDYIIQNLTSVKHYNVEITEYFGDVNYKREFDQLLLTLSSMRLDCVVAELACTSRMRSSELVESGSVFLNGIECTKKYCQVHTGDVLSIRKYGKFRVDTECGVSKKGKIKLKVLKYK